MGTVASLLIDLRELLLPRDCAGCGAPGQWWCPRCESSGPISGPISGPTVARAPEGVEVWAAGAYEPPWSDALIAYKEHGIAALRAPLANRLAAVIAAAMAHHGAGPARGPDRWGLVPVPTTRSARRRRGRDALGDLTTQAASQLGCQVLPLLTWAGSHRPQKTLHRAEREPNVAGAMRLLGGVPPPSMGLLVVDDVVTTGATIGEAMRTLATRGVRVSAGAVICAREMSTPPAHAPARPSGRDGLAWGWGRNRPNAR